MGDIYGFASKKSVRPWLRKVSAEQLRKEHREYQARYRARLSPGEREAMRKRDREYKQLMRRTDPKWLAKERERRRKYGKLRGPRERKQQSRHAEKYRSKPGNAVKEKARLLVRLVIARGEIKIPARCESCNRKPAPFKNNKRRRALRADHYQGYEKPYVVRFICVDCDGKQLRAKNKLVKIWRKNSKRADMLH